MRKKKNHQHPSRTRWWKITMHWNGHSARVFIFFLWKSLDYWADVVVWSSHFVRMILCFFFTFNIALLQSTLCTLQAFCLASTYLSYASFSRIKITSTKINKKKKKRAHFIRLSLDTCGAFFALFSFVYCVSRSS